MTHTSGLNNLNLVNEEEAIKASKECDLAKTEHLDVEESNALTIEESNVLIIAACLPGQECDTDSDEDSGSTEPEKPGIVPDPTEENLC